MNKHDYRMMKKAITRMRNALEKKTMKAAHEYLELQAVRDKTSSYGWWGCECGRVFFSLRDSYYRQCPKCKKYG